MSCHKITNFEVSCAHVRTLWANWIRQQKSSKVHAACWHGFKGVKLMCACVGMCMSAFSGHCCCRNGGSTGGPMDRTCLTSVKMRAYCCRFFKQAPDTSILAENVSFVDNIGPRIGLRASAVEGKKAYSQHMWLLRFHSSLFFSRCEVDMMLSSSSDLAQGDLTCG